MSTAPVHAPARRSAARTAQDQKAAAAGRRLAQTSLGPAPAPTPLSDPLGPLTDADDDDDLIATPAATPPADADVRERRPRDMGPAAVDASQPVAVDDTIALAPAGVPGADVAPAPAAAATSTPDGVDLGREANEDDLDRGPCFRSSIVGFTCQKAHVNGTLRIHWTPYDPASALLPCLALAPADHALCAQSVKHCALACRQRRQRQLCPGAHRAHARLGGPRMDKVPRQHDRLARRHRHRQRARWPRLVPPRRQKRRRDRARVWRRA